MSSTSRKATQQKRIDRLEQRAGICICQPTRISFYSNDAEARAGEKLPKEKCTIQGHTGPSYTAIGIYLDPCDCGACPACLGTPMTAAELAETRKHVASRRGSAESARDYDPSPEKVSPRYLLPEAVTATHEAVEARSPSPILEAQPEAPRAPAQASDRFAGLGRPSSWSLGGDHRCRCSHPHRLHDAPTDTRCRVVMVIGSNRGACACPRYEPGRELGDVPEAASAWGSDCECGHGFNRHHAYPNLAMPCAVMNLGEPPCDCRAYQPKAGA